MSITYPLGPPPVPVAGQHFLLVPKVTYMESPTSGATATVTLGYTQWQFTLDFPALSNADGLALMAWINRLQGPMGTFTYQPHGSGLALTGKTLSAAANSLTNSINIGGWTANQASGLSLGAFVTIGTQMFQISATPPANADASGICNVEVVPPVRNTIAQGTACNFATPTVTLRLADAGGGSTGGAISLTPGSVTVGSVSCIEAR